MKQKRPKRKSWSAAWGQNLRVPQCLVCRCLCYTGDTFAQTTQRKQFFSFCKNNRNRVFIYEILSKDVGLETSWQLLETASACLRQWKTFLTVNSTEFTLQTLWCILETWFLVLNPLSFCYIYKYPKYGAITEKCASNYARQDTEGFEFTVMDHKAS